MDFSENTQSAPNPEGISAKAKRNRSVSVSGRLRSASILFETGKISNEDKNSMKVYKNSVGDTVGSDSLSGSSCGTSICRV